MYITRWKFTENNAKECYLSSKIHNELYVLFYVRKNKIKYLLPLLLLLLCTYYYFNILCITNDKSIIIYIYINIKNK